MAKKIIKIAFDLDGVIVDKPPFIPKWLIEWLFRGKKKNGLHYRFPHTKIEQWVRRISHFYLFRPPINNNIALIKKIAKVKNYKLYLISGRYSFIKKETEKWLEKRRLKTLFKKIYLNLNDDQPHLYKEKIIKALKPDIYIDDDPYLVDYLRKKILNLKIYCYSLGNIPKLNIKKVNSLDFLLKGK